jgi:Protein of unknown function (DUF2917)
MARHWGCPGPSALPIVPAMNTKPSHIPMSPAVRWVQLGRRRTVGWRAQPGSWLAAFAGRVWMTESGDDADRFISSRALLLYGGLVWSVGRPRIAANDRGGHDLAARQPKVAQHALVKRVQCSLGAAHPMPPPPRPLDSVSGCSSLRVARCRSVPGVRCWPGTATQRQLSGHVCKLTSTTTTCRDRQCGHSCPPRSRSPRSQRP